VPRARVAPLSKSSAQMRGVVAIVIAWCYRAPMRRSHSPDGVAERLNMIVCG
jgi:hypothetical protein